MSDFSGKARSDQQPILLLSKAIATDTVAQHVKLVSSDEKITITTA